MMLTRFIIITFVLFSACNNNKKASVLNSTAVTQQVIKKDTVPNFFPVTSFLKGEIFGIKTGGITPVKKTTKNNKTDSVYLKEVDFENSFAEFLSPVIDTSNLKNSFTEKRFLDQTLNAFTFTYDPTDGKENNFAFTHWDVYVDPETNKVRRVYLTKNIDADTELLMTWQSGKWCKIITVKNAAIIKEEKISWSYIE